jgi:hypothetical protein
VAAHRGDAHVLNRFGQAALALYLDPEQHRGGLYRRDLRKNLTNTLEMGKRDAYTTVLLHSLKIK